MIDYIGKKLINQQDIILEFLLSNFEMTSIYEAVYNML